MASKFMSDAGYEITQGVLSHAECDALVAALNDCNVRRGRAGVRHLMSTPAVVALANDARLLQLAGTAFGGRAVPFRATLFEKGKSANWLVVWHQDTALPLVGRVISAEWGPWSTKAGKLYAHAPTWALKRIVALRVQIVYPVLNKSPKPVAAMVVTFFPDEPHITVLALWHGEDFRSVLIERNAQGRFNNDAYKVLLEEIGT
ncbi:MAG: hypothetical protein ACRD8U_17275 [Pyrinomonadaceae bacterium]